METKPHMVEQIIKFSDGTETVIKYRGVIEDGVLTPDVVEAPAVEETVETPEVAEEAPADSVEESA